MKNFRLILKSCVWVLVCVTTLSSCYTTKTGLHDEQVVVNDFPAFKEQCVGQTHNQIVTKLGAPQRTASDGQGGTILIYENTTTTSISNTVAKAYDVNYFTRTYTPGAQTSTQVSSQTDYIHYFVNSNHVCYDVKTNIPMTHVVTKKVDGPYRKLNVGKTLFWSSVPGALLAVIAAITTPAE